MPNTAFSAAFRRFVQRNISSIEQIDVLLLLLGEPQRNWSIAEISTMLRSSEVSIRSRLSALDGAKLVANGTEGYRYSASGRSHAMVEQLREEYAARRYSVIDLVFSRPDPMQSIADAFRIREEEDDAGR